MDFPEASTTGLTPEQRGEIVEVAKLNSRSPRAPEMFEILAESWVSARGMQTNTAGFVSRKRLIELLKDPFSLQALSKLLPRWVALGLVEVGPAGLRVGQKLREILDRQNSRLCAAEAKGGAASGPAHVQPTHLTAETHRPELVNAISELFVDYTCMFNGIPRSAAYGGLGGWKGSRHELADYLCGIIADTDKGNWPKDPFSVLDEMRRGVSDLKPVNAETFAYFKVKQREAQQAETAQKARFNEAVMSAFFDALGPAMAEIQAKLDAEKKAADAAQDPPVVQHENSNETLKLVPSGPTEIPHGHPWGQPRPTGSSPAA